MPVLIVRTIILTQNRKATHLVSFPIFGDKTVSSTLVKNNERSTNTCSQINNRYLGVELSRI